MFLHRYLYRYMKRTRYSIVFAALVGLMFVGRLFSQVPQSGLPEVSARITPDTILIGDRFRLTIEVSKDLAQVVDFPNFGEAGATSRDTFEVVSVSGIDTLSRSGRQHTISLTYEMTCFEAGSYNLGRFPVLYLDKNVMDTLYSKEPLSLVVRTFEIDTTKQQIVDIKKPIHTPLQFREIRNYLLWGLLALALIGLGIWLFIKMKRRESIFAPRPEEPPHVTAIRALEDMHEQKLWQNGKHKQYYTLLTDIIRTYLEGRYGISAGEMTSDEIRSALRSAGLETLEYDRMDRLFSTADLVKFAKFIPDADENERLYSDSYYFVEDTKLLPTEQVPPAKEESELPTEKGEEDNR